MLKLSLSDCLLNPLYTGNPKIGVLAKCVEQNRMLHNAAFYQGLHCLLRSKQPLGTETKYKLENSIFDPLKYTMGSQILIAPICMRQSIRIRRVNRNIKSM